MDAKKRSASPRDAAGTTENIRQLVRRLRGEGIGAVLVRGASGTFLARVAAVGAGFALHLVLARMLGAVAYGDFTYVFTWATILGSVSLLGLDGAVIRFLPSYEARESWPTLRGILRFSGRLAWVASLALAGVGLGMTLALGAAWRPALRRTFLLGFALLPLIAAVRLKESHLTGFKRPVLASFPFSLIRPLVTIVALVAAPVLLLRTSAEFAMVATGIGTLVALGFASLASRRATPAAARAVRAESAPRRQWMGVALPMLIAASMNMIAQRASILMTGALAGTEAVGFLSAAIRYADLLLFSQQAVQGLAAPMFAGLFAANRRHDLQRLVSVATLAAGVVSLPLALVLMFFGAPLLRIFGPGFETASGALIWLILGQLVNVCSGLVSPLLAMTGHHRTVAAVVAATALLSVILNLILIPWFGITGAAIATAVTIALQNIMLGLAVRRELGVHPTILSAPRIWRR